MKLKYLFHLIMYSFVLLNASSARSQPSSSIITNGENKDVKNYKNDDYKEVLETFIGDVNPKRHLLISADKKDNTPENVVNSAISSTRSYKDGSGIEISELDSQSDNHFENIRTPSYKTKRDALLTENRRNPLSYHRREKRSPEPLSNLIRNTNVHVVQNESEKYYYVDILKAIAKANDLTYIQLFNKIQYFVDDKDNSRATLSAEWNSGYIGNVTVNYYY